MSAVARLPSRLRTPTRLLPAAVLLVLLAWSGWALAVEVRDFAATLGEPQRSGAVAGWRLANPNAEGLGAFLSLVDRHLPDDRVVVLDSHLESGDQQFFLTLWAAYYLPRQRVISRDHPRAGEAAHYVITYISHLDPAQRARRGLTEVLRHPSGALYRADR